MLKDDQKGPLLRWIEERKLSDEQVATLLRAEGVDLSSGYINLLKYGFRHGSVEVADGIERMTRGKVKAIDHLRYRRPDGQTDDDRDGKAA